MARFTSVALRLAALLGLLLVGAGAVSAHADLKSSIPAAGSTVASAPARVVAAFTEELQPTGNTLKVTDARGATVDNGDTTLDKGDANRTTLVVTLKSGLANGAYTVDWQNSSADGHSEQGSFSFTVGTATSNAAPAQLPATGGTTLPLALIALGALLLIGVGRALNAKR